MLKQFSIIVVLLLPLIGQSQDQIIDLYSGVPPYSTGIQSEEVWEGMRVTNVQIPQLYIYKPKAENNTGVVVIYCPGGGYRRLSIPDYGKAYGDYFNEFGVTLVILKYRLPVSENLSNRDEVPYTDVVQAIRLIRSMATELAINPNKVGIMGGSAGGHVASAISTRYTLGSPGSSDLLSRYSSRPDFSILVYPVISMDASIAHMGSRRNLLGNNPSDQLLRLHSNEFNVTGDTPPTFLVHGTNDSSVSVLNSTKYYEALVRNNVATEMHIFQDGAHGSSFGKEGEPWSCWTDLCQLWMEKYVMD